MSDGRSVRASIDLGEMSREDLVELIEFESIQRTGYPTGKAEELTDEELREEVIALPIDVPSFDLGYELAESHMRKQLSLLIQGARFGVRRREDS